MPSRVRTLEWEIVVDIVYCEEVEQIQTSTVTYESVTAIIYRATDISIKRPIVSKCLVYVRDYISIRVFGFSRVFCIWPATVNRTNCLIWRSIGFVCVHAVIVVDFDTAYDVQPIGDVPFQWCTEHITLFLVFTHHAVLHPIWIIQALIVHTIRPVLFHNLIVRGVSLKHAHVIKVFTTREQIQTYKRVIVNTLRHHVFIILYDVWHVCVKNKFII